jgi:DnaJ-class molecular chaperone
MNSFEARKILNVDKNATDEELKKAYRRCAMDFHPDRPNGDAVKFRNAKGAYDFLLDNKDVKEEAQYSWTQESKPSPSPGFKRGKRPKLDDLDDSGWMGSGDFAKSYKSNSQGFNAPSTCKEYVDISLDEAFRGTNFKKTEILDSNGSNIIINIPRGVKEGDYLSEVVVGRNGHMSQTKFMFYARIVSSFNITFEHANKLLNGDIEKDLEISPFLMIVGGTVTIRAIDDTMIEVTIPAGLGANKLLRLEGKGYWTDETCRSRGNCYFRVVPRIKKLNDISADEMREFLDAVKTKYSNI